MKEEITSDIEKVNVQITALNSEREVVPELMRQAAVDAADLAATWRKGNVNQRQELAKALFPDGLIFSHEKRFFEPANTLLMDMFRRTLEEIVNVGVPDGI